MLVLLVFAVLMVVMTIGLMMVNYSMHASTRQSNLKQAQLTARSVASAMAKHIVSNPSSLNSFTDSVTSTPTQSMEGMGDFAVTLTRSGSDSVLITAVAHFPSEGTADPKYIASASSTVQLSREQGNGNPFCSALYVGQQLSLSNGNAVFDGTIIMLEDFGKIVTTGNPTFLQKIIVGGNFELDTSVNFPDIELFVDGNLTFDTGNSNDLPSGVWVNGNVIIPRRSTSVPNSGFVNANVTYDPNRTPPRRPFDPFDDRDLVQWLIGGTLQDCFAPSSSRVKVGSEAHAASDPDTGWDAQYNYMTSELSKLIGEPGDRELPTEIAEFNSSEMTAYFSEIGGLSEASREYSRRRNTSTFTSNSGNGYANYGRVVRLNNASENIVINNGDTDFFLKLSFEGIAERHGKKYSTTYTGNITNNGSGRVFVYADIPDTGMTIAGDIGSLYYDPAMPDKALLPMTRLFFISDHVPSRDISNNKFWTYPSVNLASSAEVNGFVYLPSGSLKALTNCEINGSVSAKYIQIKKNVDLNEYDPYPWLHGNEDILPNENFFIITSDNSDWLIGTPFESGSIIGSSLWKILVWS